MKAGYTKNITLSATLNNGTVISSNASFVIHKSDIQIVINQTSLNQTVPFNETMIIDASKSYDPDFKNASLSFNWTMKGGKIKQV